MEITLLDKPVAVAIDCADAESALALIAKLDPTLCRLKIGKELFTVAGPDFVRSLVDRGYDIFLDLKFHDIPTTVAKAVKAAANLGVWMVNVHASGGESMMTAAKDALAGTTNPPLLIAVTVLTSMSQADVASIGIARNIDEQVLHLAKLAQKSGLDGVVCSAQEAAMLKSALGQDFTLVTPGIRPTGFATGDQHRVVTPKSAIANGSDILVVGRPITQAENPNSVLEMINRELS